MRSAFLNHGQFDPTSSASSAFWSRGLSLPLGCGAGRKIAGTSLVIDVSHSQSSRGGGALYIPPPRFLRQSRFPFCPFLRQPRFPFYPSFLRQPRFLFCSLLPQSSCRRRRIVGYAKNPSSIFRPSPSTVLPPMPSAARHAIGNSLPRAP